MATTTTNSLAKFLAPLAKLGKTALQKMYREVFGRPTKSDNTQHLRAAIAKRLHELAAPPKPSSAKAGAVTKGAPRDERVPAVGTVLEREHGDVTYKVRDAVSRSGVTSVSAKTILRWASPHPIEVRRSRSSFSFPPRSRRFSRARQYRCVGGACSRSRPIYYRGVVHVHRSLRRYSRE